MRTIIKIIKRYMLFLINSVVLIVSLAIPKSKKIAVVGGWFGERFADNSKYFYLYLYNNLNELGFDKVVWVTRSKEIKKELNDKGYIAYSVWSIPSIWYHLRARYHLIDQNPQDLNAFFSVRSKRINLWHGFPLKKFGSYAGLKQFSIKNKFHRLLNKLTTRGFWADHFILATSEFSAKILGKAFGVDKKGIIVSGYPRNYGFMCDNPVKYISECEKNSYKKIKKCREDGYKIIGYFPTFRDKRETLIFGTENVEEINHFLDYCESLKIKFVGKFHFAGKNDKFGDIENHKAFIKLPSEADIYIFLDQLDILMTDYSSICFDFLFLNRPILFFPYDFEYYRDEDRGLLFDYEEFTPGPKVYSIDELRAFFSQNIEVINCKYEEKYRYKSDYLKEIIFGDYKNMDIGHLINQIRIVENIPFK